MRFMDILNLILAFLGIYGLVYALRLFLPRNIVPRVSELLDKTLTLFEHAEPINIPNVSDYRASLAIRHNQFLQMRTESHRSPGFFQQLNLLFLCGLTWRLNDLESQIETIRRKIELALDERQLAFLPNANAPNATTTALPRSPTSTRVIWHPSPSDTVIPMDNVVEPIPSSQAASSILNVA